MDTQLNMLVEYCQQNDLDSGREFHRIFCKVIHDALCIACEKGNLVMAKFVALKFNLNPKSLKYCLEPAVKGGNIETIQWILEDILRFECGDSELDKFYEEALDMARENNDFNLMEWLLNSHDYASSIERI